MDTGQGWHAEAAYGRCAQCGVFGKFKDCAGQSTVEAAFVLPVMLVAVLLLIQPGIILYDRMVMRGAAAEGCRVLATLGADQAELCESYVVRRLGAIPQQSLFHEHGSDCSWDISLEGSEVLGQTAVEITNKIKPLPLIDAGVALLNLVDDQGFLTISVREEYTVQPTWASESALSEGAAAWIGAWTHE